MRFTLIYLEGGETDKGFVYKNNGILSLCFFLLRAENDKDNHIMFGRYLNCNVN